MGTEAQPCLSSPESAKDLQGNEVWESPRRTKCSRIGIWGLVTATLPHLGHIQVATIHAQLTQIGSFLFSRPLVASHSSPGRSASSGVLTISQPENQALERSVISKAAQ
jgi:hypothetical protein